MLGVSLISVPVITLQLVVPWVLAVMMGIPVARHVFELAPYFSLSRGHIACYLIKSVDLLTNSLVGAIASHAFNSLL